MQRKTSLVLIAGALALPACARLPAGAIRIGSGSTPEEQMIAEIYAAALERAKIAARVTLITDGASALRNAVRIGAVDMAPMLVDAAHTEAGSDARMAALAASPAQIAPCLVVSELIAEQYSLLTLSTCAQLSRRLTLGTTSDFVEANLGALHRVYRRLEFKDVKTFATGDQIDALNRGDVEVATTVTTDAQIFEGHLVALEDDLHALPPERIVPIVRAAALRARPALLRAVERTTRALTNFSLRSLNVRLQLLAWTPRDVAQDFVRRLQL